MIVAGNWVKVDIIFILELLAHNVSNIVAFSVYNKSVLLNYLIEGFVKYGNGLLMHWCV